MFESDLLTKMYRTVHVVIKIETKCESRFELMIL